MSFFVRIRGRVTGPHELSEMRQMVLRGKLSRVHEVSEDGKRWIAVSQLGQLLDEPQSTASRVSSPPSAREVATSETREPEQPSPLRDAAGVSYYYSQAGSIAGPVPLAELAALASRGEVGPDDMVITEGGQRWLRAGDDVSLGKYFLNSRGRGSLPTSLSVGSIDSACPAHSALLPAAMRRTMVIGGLSLSAVLLIDANLPHDRVANVLQWWWEFFHTDVWSIGLVTLFCAFSGFVLLFVATLTVGLLRGTICTILGVAGVAILVLFGIGSVSFGRTLMASAILPILCGVELTVCLIRLRGIDARRLVRLQACFATAVLVGGILLPCANAIELRGYANSLQPWHIAALVVITLVYGLVIACGVTGLLGTRRSRWLPFGKATVVLGAAALLLLAFGAFTIGMGIAGGWNATGNGNRMVLVQILRFAVAVWAFSTLASLGVAELLAATSLTPGLEMAAAEEESN